MVRSRDDTIIDGEKPTRFFYAQERIKKDKSTITELQINKPQNNNDNDNTNNNTDPPDTYDDIIDDIYHLNTASNDEQILQEIHNFYQNLFSVAHSLLQSE